MSELRKPKDFVKSIWSLGIIEIIIYTLTGALVYVFVGDGVQSPALLNASRVIQKIAFGVALPVIFISGSECRFPCRVLCVKYSDDELSWQR